MSTRPSDKYLQKVELCLLKGIPVESCNMTLDGKIRYKICKEVYNLFVDNPMINLRDTIRNIAKRYKLDRSPAELSNDIYVIDYITSFMETGNRNIEKQKALYGSDWLMRNGMATGNDKSVDKGIKWKCAIHNNFSEQEQDYDKIAEMPIIVTNDVSILNKEPIPEEEVKALYDNYGVTYSEFKNLLSKAEGAYDSAPEDPEPDFDIFVEED